MLTVTIRAEVRAPITPRTMKQSKCSASTILTENVLLFSHICWLHILVTPLVCVPRKVVNDFFCVMFVYEFLCSAGFLTLDASESACTLCVLHGAFSVRISGCVL